MTIEDLQKDKSHLKS